MLDVAVQYVEVVLTWREVHLAGIVAISRTVDNLSKHRQDRYGLTYDSLGDEQHWLGALGEMAVAKYCNRFWTTLELGVIDVGNVEVRAVDRENKRLMLHPSDRDDVPFISALVMRKRLPVVTLRGWIMGVDGKCQGWWADPGTGRPAFFVPNSDLLPMQELPA